MLLLFLPSPVGRGEGCYYYFFSLPWGERDVITFSSLSRGERVPRDRRFRQPARGG
jgi:hypothetical protein